MSSAGEAFDPYELARSVDNEDDQTTQSDMYQEIGLRNDNADLYTMNSSDDATDAVQDMHLALLYLLSHPDEFHRALNSSSSGFSNWGDETDDDDTTLTGGSSTSPPLPYIIFADDAEVVLPQAHTVSQLFGVECFTGMELEAAAGIPSICRLFLRFLALMPNAIHTKTQELTVMKIANRRYRVTGTHEAVWTWMNDLGNEIETGELVRLNIVDVFETDGSGKLLSYSPTFDNRKVLKTDRNLYVLRTTLQNMYAIIQNSKFLKALARKAAIYMEIAKQKALEKLEQEDDDGFEKHEV